MVKKQENWEKRGRKEAGKVAGKVAQESPLSTALGTSVRSSTSASNSCHTAGEGREMKKTPHLAMETLGKQSRNQDENTEMSS